MCGLKHLRVAEVFAVRLIESFDFPRRRLGRPGHHVSVRALQAELPLDPLPQEAVVERVAAIAGLLLPLHFPLDRKPGTTVQHSIQTNGILLDPAWCEFLRENRFLVGISLDGPRELHDAYRRDKGGHGTFDRVVKAVRLMQRARVDFNILCTVNAVNSEHPLAVSLFPRRVRGALSAIHPDRRAD